MIKTYKYRIYPNEIQKEYIIKTIGCCRFVYNNLLNYRWEMYDLHRNVSNWDCRNYCTRELKSQFPWLKEADKFALENAAFQMYKTFERFIKGEIGYPKYRRKHKSCQSYMTNFTENNIQVYFEDNLIKIPKIDKIKAKLHRTFSGKIKAAIISVTSTGKYFASILVEENIEKLSMTDKKVGLDLGIKHLCVTSYGKKFENLKIDSCYEQKIIKLQKKLSDKQKGSNNYYKAKRKLALCYEKVHNKRRAYLHQISRKLVNENQVIVTEDLKIKDMVQNTYMSKSIMDASWYQLILQLKYKSEWSGRTYLKINTYFPSSQICSVCGIKNAALKNLSVRKWICPCCGSVHDRDINAAKNILKEGLKQLYRAGTARL